MGEEKLDAASSDFCNPRSPWLFPGSFPTPTQPVRQQDLFPVLHSAAENEAEIRLLSLSLFSTLQSMFPAGNGQKESGVEVRGDCRLCGNRGPHRHNGHAAGVKRPERRVQTKVERNRA